MPFPLVGLGIGLALFSAYALTRKSQTASFGAEPLRPVDPKNKLYRLKVVVHPRYQEIVKAQAPVDRGVSPQSYLTEVLSEKLRRVGFSEIVLAMNDPTDNRGWTFLARSYDRPVLDTRYQSDPSFRFVSISDPIAEPLIKTETPDTILDKGLTSGEVQAIQHALAYDNDPKHLGGFASTLETDYPLAAVILRIKAKLATARAAGLGQSPLVKDDFEGTVDLVCSRNAVKLFREMTRGLGDSVEKMWTDYEPVTNALTAKHCDTLVRKIQTAKTEAANKGPLTPIPPAAIQLAYAQKRPQLSSVANVRKIVSKMKSISAAAEAGDENGQKAKDVMSRAEKLLERRAWVEWYRRIESVQNAQQEKGPAPGSLTRKAR